MRVLPLLTVVLDAFDPADFLLSDGGVQHNEPSEHVRTLQSFLENDKAVGTGELDLQNVEEETVMADLAADMVVVDMVTETTTNANTTDADIALANALLVDMISSEGIDSSPKKDDVVGKDESEVQQFPRDPLLKDLLQHARINESEGSGGFESTTSESSVSTRSTTSGSTTTTTSTSTTTTTSTTSSTQEIIESSTIIEATTMGSGDFVVELNEPVTDLMDSTAQTTSENFNTVLMENDIRHNSARHKNIEIVCRAQSMCVSLSHSFMTELWPGAGVDDLHFEELCDDYSLSIVNERIELCIEPKRERNFLTCGTKLSGNDTHVIFNNNITTTGGIELATQKLSFDTGDVPSFVLGWRCIYPLQMVVENDDMLYKKKQIDLAARSSSEHMRHMIESGTGNFQVKFQLYRDDQFTDKVRNTIVPQLSVHDQLRVRLRLYEPLPHAKLQIQNCWATPTSDAQHPDGFFLIDEYCATDLGDEVSVDMVENGASAAARFQSKVFIFSRSSSVYLHCRVNVCLQRGNDECDLVGRGYCNQNQTDTEEDLRSRRALPDNYSKQIVTYGPINVNTGSFLLEERSPEIYNPDIGDFDRSIGLKPKTTLPDGRPAHDMFVSTILVVMIVGISLVAVILAVSLWHGGRSEGENKRLLC